uniref:Reverse transcriptase zinc-binding domain-containing protein n=1 Tax=Fagus sylvatica TaxID=28930 RepID=A0A2N9IHD6_FAGSY
MKWTLTTDGRFDVSSYYEALRGAREVLIPWNWTGAVFKKNGESSDHLFLHCCMAKQLWDCILNLFGLNWVMPRTVLIGGCWSGALGNHRMAGIWRMIPHCLTWSLERTQPPDLRRNGDDFPG